MKSLGLYRQMELLYRPRAEVDETNRELLIAELSKWCERAELEIELCLRARYEIPGTTVQLFSAVAAQLVKLIGFAQATTPRRTRTLMVQSWSSPEVATPRFPTACRPKRGGTTW